MQSDLDYCIIIVILFIRSCEEIRHSHIDRKGKAMKNMNSCNFTGNLTRDPELRTTNGGTPILTFGLAVNDSVRNEDGKWEDRPNFLDFVLYGTRATGLAKFLAKGMKVAIESKATYRSWERDGQRRSKVEFVVQEIEVLSHRNNGTNSATTSAPAAAPQEASDMLSPEAGRIYGQPDIADEDIPF